MEKIHFISGLPRSGTTLLSSILNQNPKFQASVSGPLARFTRAIIDESQSQGGYRFQCPAEKRKELIHSVADTYYKDSSEVVFDTNRGWTYMTPLLSDLYPKAKTIICIRSIPWIIDSFETLFAKNPYDVPLMFPDGAGLSVYSRAQYLTSDGGFVGFAYNGIKQAMFGPNKENVMIVQYDQLAKNPKLVMKKVYEFIGEPWYEHNFDSVEASWDEFDTDMNIKGLHHVRQKVEFKNRPTILPPDLFNHLEQMDFWKNIK
jgi:sulfotransferase